MPRKKSTSKTDTVTPQTALDAWLLDCQSRNLSPHSITFCKQQLSQFIGYLSEQGVTRLADITTAYILFSQRRKMFHQQSVDKDVATTDLAQEDATKKVSRLSCHPNR